jgi:dihydrofolate reductase
MPAPFHIEGYAIVSSDGMIADEHDIMPAALMNDADKVFFANELDRVDLVINGRRSHEGQPNSPNRRRLVMTRSVPALAPDPDQPKAFLWNPAGATLIEACAAFGLTAGSIGVIGGVTVFDYFLESGYDAFHLSRIARVALPGGMPVFSEVRVVGSPEEVLRQHGLHPGPTQILDEANAVSLVSWRKAG